MSNHSSGIRLPNSGERVAFSSPLALFQQRFKIPLAGGRIGVHPLRLKSSYLFYGHTSAKELFCVWGWAGLEPITVYLHGAFELGSEV